MYAHRYFLTLAPSYSGEHSRVLSSHATFAAARRAKRRWGHSAVIRQGNKLGGEEWIRAFEAHYPVVPVSSRTYCDETTHYRAGG